MSEVRLIDANALEKALDAWAVVLDKPHLYSREDALFVIRHHYSITPESLGWRKEVVGRWEQGNEFDEDANVYSCSACGEPWVLIDGTPKENNMSYCPNCGAKMEEKQ